MPTPREIAPFFRSVSVIAVIDYFLLGFTFERVLFSPQMV
jgi:hypothetical protein